LGDVWKRFIVGKRNFGGGKGETKLSSFRDFEEGFERKKEKGGKGRGDGKEVPSQAIGISRGVSIREPTIAILLSANWKRVNNEEGKTKLSTHSRPRGGDSKILTFTPKIETGIE